jgi:potassium-transporting ATPase potassium-binding subunit
MTANSWLQLAVYFGVLLALVRPLGWYMARVYQNQPCGLDWAFGWLERLIYRIGGVDPKHEMNWKVYAVAMLLFKLAGYVFLYVLLRAQHLLPGGPDEKFLTTPMTPDLAFNTAVSFITNTNWQAYGGENTLKYASQVLGLAVQNFLSAATGMAILVALIRGIARRQTNTIGNFWVDLTRSTLYILLPLSVIVAVLLVSQGVIQNFRPYATVTLAQAQEIEEPKKDAEGKPVLDKDGKPVMEKKTNTEQTLPMGPAASQIAIKQLGTNGGGFFNVNSAHPYENPTPLSNFLEMFSILIIAAALCWTFGEMVGDRRQGWVILAAMMVVAVPLTIGCVWAEQNGVPALSDAGADQQASATQAGGNMEGKEVRNGITNSGLWASATTCASNGSVNAMHDSFTPLGGLVPMWLIQLGEVIFGGVGSGLYGMLMFALVAVFIAGLMIGRTPEYLGKKIEAFEMKMAALVILIPPLVVLIGTAIAINGAGLKYTDPDNKEEKSALSNPGAHGFSEVLYGYSSAGNNNGSAFGGLNANNPFYNVTLAIAMLIARFWLKIPVLAIAGSLARKKYTPPGAGTLPTHTPLFVVMLVGSVLLVGALTFVPALALGPVVEHLQMMAR